VQIAFALGQRRSRRLSRSHRDALRVRARRKQRKRGERERERERQREGKFAAEARARARRIGDRREDGAERKKRSGPAEPEPRGARKRRVDQT